MKKLIFLFLSLSTAVSAQTWHQVNVPTDVKLKTIHFPTPQIGYIGGNDSTLLKSTDGGKTWSAISPTGINFFSGGLSFEEIHFITDLVGYAVIGPYGGLYKTTDGGLTWNHESTANAGLCFVYTAYFFNEQNGFVGGSGCFSGEIVDKLSNGNWQTTTMVENWHSDYHITGFDFYDQNLGLASSTQSYIYKTTDGGLNWDTIASSLDTVPVTDVLMINDTLAYATYNQDGGFGILISEDGGDAWQIDINAATFWYPSMYCLHQSGNGYIYAGGEPSWGGMGLILEKTNMFWTGHNMDQPIHDLGGYGDSIVFAVGDSGYVATNTNPNNLFTKENNLTQLNVFPNPTADIFTLTKDNQESISIELYDLTGKLVYSVLTNSLSSIHSVRHLNTGVYFLSVTDGNTSSSLKLIINK